MTITFKMVLRLAQNPFLLLRNNILHGCALKICIINVGLIFNSIK